MSGTVDNIMTKVISHYESQVIMAAASFIGSLNILGNPAKLIRELKGEVELEIDPGIQSNSFIPQKDHFFARRLKG
jgi:hypothetical protein